MIFDVWGFLWVVPSCLRWRRRMILFWKSVEEGKRCRGYIPKLREQWKWDWGYSMGRSRCKWEWGRGRYKENEIKVEQWSKMTLGLIWVWNGYSQVSERNFMHEFMRAIVTIKAKINWRNQEFLGLWRVRCFTRNGVKDMKVWMNILIEWSGS